MNYFRLLMSQFFMIIFTMIVFCSSPAYAEDVFSIVQQGIASYEKGDFQKSIKDLKLAVLQLKERPEDQERNQALFQANLYLGLSYLGTGQENLAREVFRDAILAQPKKSLDPDLFSPKVISLYNEVAGKILSHLSIESNVNGAEIFLNDEKKGVTPLNIRNIFPGEYRVKVVIGLQEAVKNIVLEAGKEAVLVADFEHLGFLSITSDPSGANISMENLKGLTTPFSTKIPSGSYTIVVSKEGYKASQHQVIVKENETETVHATLIPSRCSIGVSSEPERANVYLDGVHKGTTPLLIKDVTGGPHSIKIEKDGYQVIEETLHANQLFIEKTYQLLLDTGSLSIETEPAGVRVLIDGKQEGITPLRVGNLAVKEYLVSLEKEGYMPKTLTASIQKDKITQIKETLIEIDNRPPTITFVPLEKIAIENKNYVKARVIDNSEVKEVSFIFTSGEWRYAHRIEMEQKTKGYYETLIPDARLKMTTGKLTSIKYYISACDIYNNCSSEGSQDSPFIVGVTSIEPYTEGYILRIERDSDYDIKRITTSIGVEDGVRKGDEYVVFRTGKRLKDPRTDEVLQIEEVLVGTIEIKELMPKTAYAEVDDDYLPLQENDRIRKVVSSPRGVTTEGTSGEKIIVRWYPNTEPEVKGYRIYRSSQANGTYERIGSTRGRDSISYKDDDHIRPGVTYYYRITAYNILDKDSEMSQPVAGTAR